MDSSLYKHINRRQRFSEDISRFSREDRISNLPNEVISHILSFLPTKYAVGTTILSKRWNYIWTSVKNLDFDCCSSSDEITKLFVGFVDRVLFFHDGTSIEKFRVSCSRVYAVSQLYTWVSAVLPCHVKELQLIAPTFHQADNPCPQFRQIGVPWSLFTCKTLTILKLNGGFVLHVPACVCLPVLKILHLNSVIYVDDVSIQKLISGCPVLEDLDIERKEWDGVRVINVSSTTLKRLAIQFFLYGYYERCSYNISVSAPNLLYLKLADNRAVEYSVDNLPSLVEAQIGVYNYASPRSLELVEQVTHVRVLQLSGKILEFMESDEDYELPLFHNLTRLELGANKEAGWDLLADILESTPNLEVLVFPRGLVKRKSFSKKPYFEFEWYPPHCVPTCLLLSLETVIIHDFFGKNCEMNLVEYLLENAKLLKKMTIHFLDFKPNQQLSCQRCLQQCRKASPTCKLELIF